ncbi:MAG: hypothetical protein AAF656_13975 [Planctomycetota bacterium]
MTVTAEDMTSVAKLHDAVGQAALHLGLDHEYKVVADLTEHVGEVVAVYVALSKESRTSATDVADQLQVLEDEVRQATGVHVIILPSSGTF